MKKKIILTVLLLTMFITTSCNKQLLDMSYNFNKAVIMVGDEILTVEIQSWKDFEDGDQIQITTKDGKDYLLHSSNCTLIKDN